MKRNFKAILFYIALIAIVVFSVSSLLGQTKQEKLLYSDIVDQFASELMKRITLPLELDFMKVSSYGSGTSSTGVINIHLDINRKDVADVDFIIVEDIIDSGRTLSHLIKYFTEKGAGSVRTVTLLDKPSRRTVEFVPDYCGKTIPDKFVVGFGLDYDEKYRNLPFVGVLSPNVYMNH
jgi:hypoxanthine phosphoribosyltransferase